MERLFILGASAAGSQPSIWPSLAIGIGMLALLYFLMIRPQKKQEKKLAEQRAAMKIGDEIVTIGGVVGKIVNIQDDNITIATSVANTLMMFRRDAIGSVLNQKPEDKKKASSAKDAKASAKNDGAEDNKKR